MGQYSNGVHVVYIPYTDCKEELDSVKNWNDWNSMKGQNRGGNQWAEANQPYKAKRNFVAVDENNPVIPANLNFASSAENVLYVLGHCDSGSSSLSSSATFMGISKESVNSEDLAKRVSKLIGDPAFSGGIKVYGCKSASNGIISFSFTYEFAKKMLDPHGYKSCTIYGYTECVSNYQSSYASDKEGDVSEFHKVVKMNAKHVGAVLGDFVKGSRTELQRAKDVRLVVAQNGKMIAK